MHARYVQDQTPLHVASQLSQVHVMESLITLGANLSAENDFKETPLFLAAKNGNMRVTQLLLERRVEVDHQDWEKRTPLQRASENGHHTVASLLLISKANSETKTCMAGLLYISPHGEERNKSSRCSSGKART